MKNIVAAVDFSNATPGVLDSAAQMAKAFGAALHVLHVVEPEPSYTAYGFTPDEFPAIHLFQEEARKRATARLNELLGKVSSDVPNTTVHLAEGSPLHAVLDYVKKFSVDLVVVGAHGHGAMAVLLLGSVAEGLVRKAVVPTLVIPAVAEK
ncbi:universal stress protein [Haloferula sp. BvORR071]|uniref:universal stress protein n=1 Tax=Haloferula sp. BvORR071 TaxID=1396141 RepID=UPI000558D535|nr:universal stress protein [Haloferula sp. BvORR071]